MAKTKINRTEEAIWNACNVVWKNKKRNGNWWADLVPLMYLIDNKLDLDKPEIIFKNGEEFNKIMEKWTKDNKCQEYVFVMNNFVPKGEVESVRKFYEAVLAVYYLHKENKSLFDELKNKN